MPKMLEMLEMLELNIHRDAFDIHFEYSIILIFN